MSGAHEHGSFAWRWQRGVPIALSGLLELRFSAFASRRYGVTGDRRSWGEKIGARKEDKGGLLPLLHPANPRWCPTFISFGALWSPEGARLDSLGEAWSLGGRCLENWNLPVGEDWAAGALLMSAPSPL